MLFADLNVFIVKKISTFHSMNRLNITGMAEILSKPDVFISTKIKKKLAVLTKPEGQVIIHGQCKAGADGMAIRIWPTTFLFDCHSSHKSQLLFFENITGFPEWTLVRPFEDHLFTLIFSALPSECILFDLKEVIPQANGFEIPAIARNNTDVYHVDFL